MTLACARLGWSVQDTEVISLVTAEPHTAVRRGGRAVVLSRDASTPGDPGPAAHRNRPRRFGASPFSSSSADRRSGAATPPRASGLPTRPRDVDDLNVVAVHYLPDERVASLPDDAFDHDGQITKHDVRAVTLAALAPRPGRTVVGRRRRLGQHRGRMVPQRRPAARQSRSSGTSSAVSGSDAMPSRSVCASRCAAPAPRRVRRRRGPVGDLRRRRPDPARPAGRLPRPPARRRPAGCQRGHGRVRSRSGAVVFVARRRAAAVSALCGEPLGKFTGWRPAMPVTQWAVTKR